MIRLFNYLFPKKTKWEDVGCYDRQGNYHLVQMRKTIHNKKEFRIVKIGFINDYTQKTNLYQNILKP